MAIMCNVTCNFCLHCSVLKQHIIPRGNLICSLCEELNNGFSFIDDFAVLVSKFLIICHLFIFQISKWFPQFFNIIVFFNKRIHFIFNWNSGGFFRSSVVTKYMYFRFSYINLLIKLTIRSAVKSISVVGHKLRLVKKKDKYFSYRIWAFYNICIQSSS